MAWSRHTTWRQGSVLAQKDFQSLGLGIPPRADIAIAISHDCDIANDNMDSEPAVEFIYARLLDNLDGNCTHGKNPRALHIKYTHDGQPIFIELLASRKIVIPKTVLGEIQPDQTYNLDARPTLQSWLAIRYRRQALPNSLVERLRTVSSYIEKEIKRNPSAILSLRLSYDPKDELPPEEAYELYLSIIYNTDKPEYVTIAEAMAKKMKEEVTTLLEKSESSGKVDLRKCEAFSETSFTVRDMRDTDEYHLEHLSYRTDPSGPVI
jgi:hypothetical protein